MTLTLHADEPPLRTDADGVVRVAKSRVPLERVVRSFLSGMTPEQIAHDYDVLKVEDVYAVVTYYLHHRAEIDAYLATATIEEKATRQGVEAEFDPAGIRARLLAKRAGGAG